MDTKEAGRIGGRLVASRYGREHYQKMGRKGGRKTAERGSEFFSRIGTKGGAAVSKKYGKGHFERIGRIGGKKVADLIRTAKEVQEG